MGLVLFTGPLHLAELEAVALGVLRLRLYCPPQAVQIQALEVAAVAVVLTMEAQAAPASSSSKSRPQTPQHSPQA